ncbi:MAG: hypothetical protein J5744_07745 [Oscillospiraceae bacterium]|nr:hypothetical protein [Oscillospiraceae bacterium]
MQQMKMNEPVLTREPPRGIRGDIEVLQEKISNLYRLADQIRVFIAGNRNEDDVPNVSPDCLTTDLELLVMKVDRTGIVLTDVIKALEG